GGQPSRRGRRHRPRGFRATLRSRWLVGGRAVPAARTGSVAAAPGRYGAAARRVALAGRAEHAEQAVLGLLHAGGEPDRVLTADPGGAALQVPQALDRDRLAVGPAERAEVPAGARVVGVDPAVAEVADEQGVGEGAEPLRRED